MNKVNVFILHSLNGDTLKFLGARCKITTKQNGHRNFYAKLSNTRRKFL